MRFRIATLASSLAASLAALGGCNVASLTGNTSTNGMSQSQAQGFATQVATATSNGVKNSHPMRAPAQRGAGPFPISPTLVNVSVSQRTTCTSGGYISVLGGMSGSIDNNGTGVLLLSMTESIVDWQCIGGFVINGDPYISASGTFSYLNGQPGTRQDMTISGGFKWGTTAAQSCQIQLSILFNQTAGTYTMTGNVCGYQVSASG